MYGSKLKHQAVLVHLLVPIFEPQPANDFMVRILSGSPGGLDWYGKPLNHQTANPNQPEGSGEYPNWHPTTKLHLVWGGPPVPRLGSKEPPGSARAEKREAWGLMEGAVGMEGGGGGIVGRNGGEGRGPWLSILF